MMNFKNLFWDNRLHVAFTLFLIWLLSLWYLRTLNAVIFPILAILVVSSLDLIITRVRDGKFYVPSASLVTGFLIGLILDLNQPVWVVALAAAVASLGKQFIKSGLREHVFNPAAFGIMAINLAWGVPVAWWGVAVAGWSVVILIALMVRILFRLKRLMLPATFLAVYFLYLIFQSGFENAIRTLVDGSVLLFALVMLPEPITSPATGNFRWGFGVMVAALAIGLEQTKIAAEVFLPALLLANLIAFGIKQLNKSRAEVAVEGKKRQ